MNKKTALITGAAGNLGQAVVQKFIAEGFRVVGTRHTALSSPSGLTSDDLEMVTLDLLNEENAGNLVAEIIRKYGRLDAAVLTAGGFAMGDIASTGIRELYRQYQLNFETAYTVAKPVFAQMLQQNNGRIFFIGAPAGLDAAQGKGMTAYSLSKSLLFHLAGLMNAEAGGKDVRAKVVVPTIIDTPQNRKAMPNADFSGWEAPADLAEMIYRDTLNHPGSSGDILSLK
jgi:NAD(P)-dependent dehydrogenase (short-subunit alcohol dehydrogenase family)